jgi:hypothetical protein
MCVGASFARLHTGGKIGEGRTQAALPEILGFLDRKAQTVTI